MDELNEDVEGGGVSRRDALKKMGVTAVGFWAVPVISSFRSPAFAQVIVSPSACVDWNCTIDPPIQICGDTPGCGSLSLCGCDVTVEGDQFCWQNASCADVEPCTSTADCEPGWGCVTSCCGTTCAAPCGTCVTGTVLTTSGPNMAGV